MVQTRRKIPYLAEKHFAGSEVDDETLAGDLGNSCGGELREVRAGREDSGDVPARASNM